MFEDHISITSKVFKRKIFKKAYFWIVLVLGVLFIVLGKIDSIPLLPDWKSMFTTLGTILLTSGIFTSLLKTIQYLDIIKEELSKIIYDVDYLKTRNDIDNLWKKINRVVFGERFAEISEAIQKDIKRVYLPNNLERYYKNYRFDI